MSKFITGKKLENVIYDIIWDAQKTLMIVSPFIRLDDYFKKLFDKHLNNPDLHILIVFGKNEKMVSKSLSKNDFDYFQKFMNISVVYVPNLHAKYYANEKRGVITSINLHDYSFINNVEFGVYSELNLLTTFTSNPDSDAWETCVDLAMKSEAVFIKRPVYEKGLLSSLLGKNYVKSDVLHDVTDKFYNSWSAKKSKIMKLKDFPDNLELKSAKSERPQRDYVEEPSEGYCIRTGKKIPFNLKKPYTDYSYQTWKNFGNPNYPENYCHKTGKSSDGKTSMNKPIL